jgi:uncharacterized protein
MNGYQISFITEMNQRIEGKPATEWLIHLAKELGCSGATTFAGVESFVSDGRRHSAHFFDLVDQPIEIMMAVTEQQATAMFAKIKITEARLFYIKAPVEYGEIGARAATSI